MSTCDGTRNIRAVPRRNQRHERHTKTVVTSPLQKYWPRKSNTIYTLEGLPVRAPALFAVAGPSSLPLSSLFFFSVTSLTPLPAPLVYCLSESLARHRSSAPDRSMAAPWRRMPHAEVIPAATVAGGLITRRGGTRAQGVRGAHDTARSSAGGHPCHYRAS